MCVGVVADKHRWTELKHLTLFHTHAHTLYLCRVYSGDKNHERSNKDFGAGRHVSR